MCKFLNITLLCSFYSPRILTVINGSPNPRILNLLLLPLLFLGSLNLLRFLLYVLSAPMRGLDRVFLCRFEKFLSQGTVFPGMLRFLTSFVLIFLARIDFSLPLFYMEGVSQSLLLQRSSDLISFNPK
ncbi:uncharacterized protein [Euphorbia lathyris]|uniref:uncharacterized protein n=1 Tax=Euphorbia lathyris TaxID=212925 RepID=UPI0033131723